MPLSKKPAYRNGHKNHSFLFVLVNRVVQQSGLLCTSENFNG